MSIRMRCLPLFLTVLLPALAAAQAARPLASLRMPAAPEGGEVVFSGLDIPLDQDSIDLDVDVGEDIFGQKVVLIPGKGAETRSFKVQYQYVTSLTVNGGGEHLDLLDWKHHVSEWADLKPVGKLELRMPAYSEEEAVRFPSVSAQEIRQAVLKAGGEGWARQVKAVKGPNDDPAMVSISTVRLRILVQEGNDWKVLHQVNLNLPMGC